MAEGYAWYLLAGSVDLSGLMYPTGPMKSFDSLSAGVQTALTEVLDAGRDGRFDDAFFQTGQNEFLISTGLGFVLQADPFDEQAYGFPALNITGDPSMPIGVSPDGPVIAITKKTLDALTDQRETLLNDAMSQAMQGVSDQVSEEIRGFMEDFDDFMSQLKNDDASDGSISASQHFSLTIPGAEFNGDPQAEDIQVDADLTLDLDSTDNGARWLGGVGVDITASGFGEPGSSESITLEMAFGEQRIDHELNVIRLEPGPGTEEDLSRLEGDWVASLNLNGVLGTIAATPLAAPDASYSPLGKTTPAAAQGTSPEWTPHRRMAHATRQVLSALTGRLSPTDAVRAQMIEPEDQLGVDGEDSAMSEGDTLWMKLRFDASGSWHDLAFAIGWASDVPADDTFESLHEALAVLESQLNTPLPPVELRVSTTPDQFIRLDIVATDLIAEFLRSFSGSMGMPVELDTAEAEIPDLSLITFGGVMADDRIDGQVVILLFVEDIHFARQ